MAKLKNVSHYPIEAVKEDRTIMKFAPNEIQVVDDKNTDRFLNRYPELKVVERELHKPLECEFCGFIAKNNAGISAHRRRVHKEELAKAKKPVIK